MRSTLHLVSGHRVSEDRGSRERREIREVRYRFPAEEVWEVSCDDEPADRVEEPLRALARPRAY